MCTVLTACSTHIDIKWRGKFYEIKMLYYKYAFIYNYVVWMPKYANRTS